VLGVFGLLGEMEYKKEFSFWCCEREL
jgi:hypothetical protein